MSEAHGHSHGLVDRSITRSRAGAAGGGARASSSCWPPAVAQIGVFVATGSVALLADLIHNVGDALTAVPLGDRVPAAQARAERGAGYIVVAVIFFSACVAAFQAVDRLINPQDIDHLLALGAGGRRRLPRQRDGRRSIRLRAGRRLESPALVADGYHARTDGLVSLAVVASAIVVALGLPAADPVIGLVIALVILRITWQSWRTVRHG